ncbi:glycoside hydrolase family 25 protein [Sclerotinia borealis F-4128]|uniref:Glycoside hydrolase family 25 protein n=1 Tax=Sclerotinia borealis (strain F-4128) TaxID=1432307 RepID=W9CI69_SCLBF|nr:glycoside hydrolase family 25 protein [Sclerotinia borealis F-4128]
MSLLKSFIAFAGIIAVASSNRLVPRASIACSTSSGPGFCQSTSRACSGGKYIAGACPGGADNQCCVATCSSGKGACQATSVACSSGSSSSGLCPGPADIQCCIKSGGGTTPLPSTGAGSLGIDISQLGTPEFFACAKKTKDVVAIRGYQQACGTGGQVDKNFAASYKNAKAAGFTGIDSYIFPCSGTPTGSEPKCKSVDTQIAEYLKVISDNHMNINTLWLDLEPTSVSNYPCNAWNLGAAANEKLAKQWVSAMKATGLKWGIYANGNQWSGMFASRSTDIGSELPLWAVQQDYKEGVNTVDTFMGGWTKAVAKQYRLDTKICGLDVDLDSFL